MFDEGAEELTKTAIELAKKGDPTAMRLCMDGVCPPSKSRPVAFELPRLETATDAVTAAGTIVQALAAGDLAASEAAELMKVVQGFAQTVSAAELEQRVARIEEKLR